VKYSLLATNVIGRRTTRQSTKESTTERWFAASTTGPRGHVPTPVVRGRVSSQTSGPTTP
jgi:hypothetical protein